MVLSADADAYIRESIASSLGLPVSAKTLRLKLLASEDDRRRLRDQIFTLQDRLLAQERKIDLCKAESTLNALGLKRCVEEREVMMAEYASFENHCAKLEKDCQEYERAIEKLMESCDELGKENEELREIVQENFTITKLVAEVESFQKDMDILRINLQKDMDILRINLQRAEDEVNVLFEENRILDEENRKLARKLKRENHLQGSDRTYSSSASSKGKRKPSVSEISPGQAIDFSGEDTPPVSPLNQNSPDSATQVSIIHN